MSDLSDAKQELTLQACLFVPKPPKFLFFFQTKTLAGLIHVAMEDSVRKLVEALLAIAHWDSKERHV